MSAFLQWLNMHGYAFYVWSAYGLVFGVLTANVLLIKYQAAQIRKRLQLWFKQVS